MAAKKTVKRYRRKRKSSCKKEHNNLISKLEKMGKLYVKYGSKKIKLNIGCPELKKRKKRKNTILPPSIYNI